MWANGPKAGLLTLERVTRQPTIPLGRCCPGAPLSVASDLDLVANPETDRSFLERASMTDVDR